MAAEEHVVTVPDAVHPWTLAFEIADATPPGSWALVGGLMVHVHALRAGITPSRPTRDVDLLLRMGTRTVSDVASPLQALVALLSDSGHVAWAVLDGFDRAFAQRTCLALTEYIRA